MNKQPWIRGALLLSMAFLPLNACVTESARDEPRVNARASSSSSSGSVVPNAYPDPPPVPSVDAGQEDSGGSDARSEFGAPAPPTPDYVVDTETATSKTTGLVWLRATLDTRFTGGSCSSRCQDLTAANHDDWRAPTIAELQGILVQRAACPFIDEDAFPLTLCTWYTSSETTNGGAADFLMLSFYSGEVKSRSEAFPLDTGYPCRCVR